MHICMSLGYTPTVSHWAKLNVTVGKKKKDQYNKKDEVTVCTIYLLHREKVRLGGAVMCLVVHVYAQVSVKS